MPQNNTLQVQSSFIAGLKTEFTGLNFPENAVTDTSNVVYGVTGENYRRGGIDYEANFQLNNIGVAAAAKSHYKWDNVGGDGATQMLVQQIGATLYFYNISTTTVAAPLSTQKLSSTVSITPFLVSGSAADPSQYECTYAAGNGYLFVYNPVCEPFYVSYDGVSTMTATRISVQIRDVIGIPDELQYFNSKPATLSTEHQYNLVNQGWSLSWSATLPVGAVTSYTTGSHTYAASAIDFTTFPITDNTTQVQIIPSDRNDFNPAPIMTGTVTDHSNGSITVNVLSLSSGSPGIFTSGLSWVITPYPSALFDTYVKAFGAYPSNAEQWWWYRNTNVTDSTPDGSFSPSTTKNYVILSNNQAPQGAIIFNAFNQDRSTPSFVPGITNTTTLSRPTNGAWFQGRTWFTGLNNNFQASGDVPFYTWTENIYFSQITATSTKKFGYCYQQNDPTNDTLYNELPDDGGVIVVQGSGAIYKLFSVQNGMLIFAANGIWFLTGSTGIGFTANDYTITKISGVRISSSTSFVDVLGWPMFWNEEGIYTVTPSQQGGGLEVNNLVIGTIATAYNNIPFVSKRYARGTYDPMNYIVQWLYRSTAETTLTTRYQYDSVLLYNVSTKAFYTYSLTGDTYLHDVMYIASPGSSASPDPVVKYVTSNGTNFTFSEENDFTNYVDFHSGTPVNYVSTYTTGYMLHGKAAMKFQVPYVYMFADTNNCSYKINGQWNYSNTGNSGKWTNTQIFTLNDANYDRLFNRVRIRGRGNVLQLKITSQDGLPFAFSGWALYENINASI